MQVRKSHIVKNDARMYYGNICNSFNLLILYHIMVHIVALLENEIMEEWQSDFMPWFPISQLRLSEKLKMLTFQMQSGNDGFTDFLECQL